MNFTLWQKITFALSYNESIGHNIMLTLIYAIAAAAIFIFFLLLIKSLTHRSEQPKTARKGIGIGSVIGMAAILFWGVIFPVGLFLILTVTLQSVSSAKVIGDGVYFTYNKEPAVAVLTDEYKANGTDRGITYGSSKIYATAILPKSGKTIWKVKLDRTTSQSPKIFHSKDTYIWLFDSSKLTAIDKKTGAIKLTQKALEKKAPELSGKFPTSSDNYTSRGNKIIFKGLDGDIYQFDTVTKRGKHLAGKVASDYFSDKSSPIETDLTLTSPIITMSPAKPDYAVFLSASDIKKIESGATDMRIAQNTEERRDLYLTTLHQKDKISVADRQKLDTPGFINGHFLLQRGNEKNAYQFQLPPAFQKYRKKPSLPDTSHYTDAAAYNRDYTTAYDKQSEYLTQKSNYDSFFNQFRPNNKPPKAPLLADDQLFIIHAKTIEGNSGLLISSFDTKKRTVHWTVPLGNVTISDYRQIDDSLILFIGAGNPENTVTINIHTGKAIGYNFHYNRSYDVKKNDDTN